MKQRINWILILKAYAMLLVIIGHSLMYTPGDEANPQYANIIYALAKSFRMPLFVFSSGFLFYITRVKKYMPYWEMFTDKLKRLGIPFIVLTLIAMVLKGLFADMMARPSSISINEFISAILYPFNGPMREFWFIIMSIWFYVLSPLLVWILNDKKRCCIGFIVLALFNALLPIFEAGEILCIGTTLRYLIWFYAGMLCSKYEIFNKKRNSYVYLLTYTVLYIALYLICPQSLRVLVSMVGILMSVELAFVLDLIYPKIFSSFSKYTYQIFLIGIFIQIFVKIGYKHQLYSYDVSFILCIITGIYFPVIVSKIAEKINWTPLLLSIGLSKKND